MAKRIDFKLDGNDCIELGRSAMSRGEAEKAAAYFKTACGISDTAEAYTELGIAYAKIKMLGISDAVLYIAMSKAESEDDEVEALWQLCSNALERGDPEVAAYYLRYLGEDDSALLSMADEGKEPRFRIAPKPDNAFYEARLLSANEALAYENYDDALEQLRGFEDAPEPYRTAAEKIRTVCFFAKGDTDRVVAISEDMLKREDTLDNKATLATAYCIQERNNDAQALLDDILAEPVIPVEVALKLIPIAVTFNRDADVLRLAEIAGEKWSPVKPFCDMHRSQALYNLGRRKEAERVLNKINSVCWRYYPATYYLKLYQTNPDRVEYSNMLPPAGALSYFNSVKTVLTGDDVGKIRDALAYDADFNDALRWALDFANHGINLGTVICLKKVRCKQVERLFRDKLITPDLGFDVMSEIIDYLLGGGLTARFDIVTQDRFKPVDFVLPRRFHILPERLKSAVYRTACDIVFTDEDPTTYLERLASIINEMTASDASGKLVWKCRNGKRIGSLRNEETMIGVLLSKVYFDDPDPDEDAMERYDLSPRTFAKYKRIFFGDDDDSPEDGDSHED